MKPLSIRPLSRTDFSPFGDVIELDEAKSFAINGGKCIRYHDLAKVETSGPEARTLVSLLRGEPYEIPLKLTMVERHPFGSQAFIPLTENSFLVVVAPDEGGRPGEPIALETAPGQGVNIARNVWHGILTPLHSVSDFVVIDRGGSGSNLEEYFFNMPYLVSYA
ncbi:ureidoglycolate lyase [Sinorhizobium numidicum]|uniref:Ureidoglycolate lyase n=1 Tax=Sinorhizobium numidicum TaxID=680248 RepID=A0ABY8CSZ7_9HYPH|nr:ureidoglycolate lyase [Sinorhizobium numidicum]WEX75724.1 ureidoglycolate lyase [Sinorhizobium numidicum]WEX81714.1 ureidoglycolate lyase [Sinorhizobium numidicum]